jgi:hypothetical protein
MPLVVSTLKVGVGGAVLDQGGGPGGADLARSAITAPHRSGQGWAHDDGRAALVDDGAGA